MVNSAVTNTPPPTHLAPANASLHGAYSIQRAISTKSYRQRPPKITTYAKEGHVPEIPQNCETGELDQRDFNKETKSQPVPIIA